MVVLDGILAVIVAVEVYLRRRLLVGIRVVVIVSRNRNGFRLLREMFVRGPFFPT